jgi:hypothetical protein
MERTVARPAADVKRIRDLFSFLFFQPGLTGFAGFVFDKISPSGRIFPGLTRWRDWVSIL